MSVSLQDLVNQHELGTTLPVEQEQLDLKPSRHESCLEFSCISDAAWWSRQLVYGKITLWAAGFVSSFCQDVHSSCKVHQSLVSFFWSCTGYLGIHHMLSKVSNPYPPALHCSWHICLELQDIELFRDTEYPWCYTGWTTCSKNLTSLPTTAVVHRMSAPSLYFM